MAFYQYDETYGEPKFKVELQAVMKQVYLWMTVGLALSAGVAYLTIYSPLFEFAIQPGVMMIAIVAEFALVFALTLGLNKMNTGVALLLFFVYAALNGFTLSLVLLS